MADNFDVLSSTGPEFKMPAASALAHAPAVMDADAEQIGEAIQVWNNREFVPAAKLAIAMDRIANYHGTHPEMLQDLKASGGASGIARLQDVKENAIRQLNSGVDKATVEQNIKLELDTMFEEKDVERVQQALYRQMAMPLNSNHLKRNTFEGFVKAEVNDARDRQKEIAKSYSNLSPTDGRIGRAVNNEANDLLDKVYGTTTTTSDQKEMAKQVTIVANRASGKFSEKQQIEAMRYIAEHKGDDQKYQDMLDTALDQDFDELNASLAISVRDKISGGENYSEDVRKWAVDTKQHYVDEDNAAEEISVVTLYNERLKSDDEIVKDIVNERIAMNRDEAEMLRKFAEDLVVEEKAPEATVNGMTRDDILDKAQIEREKASEEAVRATVTSASAILANPIGAAAGIAFAETDKGPFAEGAAGAFTGMVAGDAVAETVMGGTRTRTYKMRNPYTGEIEEVTLRVGGAFAENIQSYNDPSLPSDVSARIRDQFLDTKIKKQKAEDEARRKAIDAANKRNKM